MGILPTAANKRTGDTSNQNYPVSPAPSKSEHPNPAAAAALSEKELRHTSIAAADGWADD
jgi:hypothetical protein